MTEQTLYRAAATPEALPGAHFSVDSATARAFLRPDRQLFRFQVKAASDRVLDACKGCKALAQVVASKSGKPSLLVEEDWWGRKLGSVFDVLEHDPGTVELLSQHYDWVRFREDFPPGSVSWRYLARQPLKGAAE